jgi:hypothetical protein
MKLKDFKRSGTTYSALVADVAGNRDYELNHRQSCHRGACLRDVETET